MHSERQNKMIFKGTHTKNNPNFFICIFIEAANDRVKCNFVRGENLATACAIDGK